MRGQNLARRAQKNGTKEKSKAGTFHDVQAGQSFCGRDSSGGDDSGRKQFLVQFHSSVVLGVIERGKVSAKINSRQVFDRKISFGRFFLWLIVAVRVG